MARFVLLLSCPVPEPLHLSKGSCPCFFAAADHRNPHVHFLGNGIPKTGVLNEKSKFLNLRFLVVYLLLKLNEADRVQHSVCGLLVE
jgi:hypothetical protein